MTAAAPAITELTATDEMKRQINRNLMVSFINHDLVRRANLDVRKSIVFYDDAELFAYALANMPDQELMDRLANETGIRFWSRGIV